MFFVCPDKVGTNENISISADSASRAKRAVNYPPAIGIMSVISSSLFRVNVSHSSMLVLINLLLMKTDRRAESLFMASN